MVKTSVVLVLGLDEDELVEGELVLGTAKPEGLRGDEGLYSEEDELIESKCVGPEGGLG
jgi:hypothetical protein|uniref:Uncharacterized protein n=1 Tax=Picea glauca TaxID=3330 RepID=A0A117NFV3_PICGL|nr:hypothetical protein ABT39_MTgene2201 [Picea glauca]